VEVKVQTDNGAAQSVLQVRAAGADGQLIACDGCEFIILYIYSIKKNIKVRSQKRVSGL
jgi:hypothetical protein